MENNNLKAKNKKRVLLILIIFALLAVIFIFIKIRQTNDKNTPLATPSPINMFKPNEISLAKISPITSTSGFENNQIYGINRKNGSLINFKNNKETVIYSGKVSDYYIKDNIAIVLDKDISSEIIVIDLNTKTQKKIDLSFVAPVISITLSDDLQTIYFLADFNINKKISSINSISVNGNNHKKIGNTPAQSLRYLKNDILLLFESRHDQDKNVLHLFDIAKAADIKTELTNNFQISPDKNHISLQTSNSIKIMDTNNFQSKSKYTQLSNRSVWKDNNTLVLFKNGDQGIYYAVLTLEPFNLSPFVLLVQNSAIHTAFGFIGNTLYWQDYQENINTTIVP